MRVIQYIQGLSFAKIQGFCMHSKSLIAPPLSFKSRTAPARPPHNADPPRARARVSLWSEVRKRKEGAGLAGWPLLQTKRINAKLKSNPRVAEAIVTSRPQDTASSRTPIVLWKCMPSWPGVCQAEDSEGGVDGIGGS
uniref:Uncharacterized protein n=1 Tax=Knipowitschia caucasica TaxID=637954 RepID=A0AAV2KQH6_KNICA